MMKSLYAGVSGLKVHQVKMDNIANNIANVNTVGYKKTKVNFQEMLTQERKDASGASETKGGTNAIAIGLGVQLGSQDTINTQGNLQTTNRNLDIAIQGNGYFTVKDSTGIYHTRNGNFNIDAHGNLVNANGMYVMGKMTDENGKINSLYPLEKIQLPVGQSVPPKNTTQVEIANNLDASAKPGDKHMTSIEVFDNFGTPHIMELGFEKLANPNEWKLNVSLEQNDSLIKEWLSVNVPNFDSLDEASKEIEVENANNAVFNGAPFSRTSTIVFKSDGTFDIDATRLVNGTAAPDTLPKFSFSPAGASPVEIAMNVNKLTQYSSITTAMAVYQNGNPTGILKSLTFNEKGDIYGVFSNGFSKKIGVIALATFANPEGLKKKGSSLFTTTTNSGEPSYGVPGATDKGELAVGYLEMSNVDLSEELTSMIITQRGFQVNSKSITTSDEMLQELVNLKR